MYSRYVKFLMHVLYIHAYQPSGRHTVMLAGAKSGRRYTGKTAPVGSSGGVYSGGVDGLMLGSEGGDHVADTQRLRLTARIRAGPLLGRRLEVPEVRASLNEIEGPDTSKNILGYTRN
jgi:hypothetical protein